jgi:hypothetical protein
MKDGLIVGCRSQLAQYFPESFVRIDSRDWLNGSVEITNQSRCSIIAFGENRTYIDRALGPTAFNLVNNILTIESIYRCLEFSQRVIVFATSELWGRCNGGITVDTPFNFHESNYISSKLRLVENIRSRFVDEDVRIVYPYNFNTRHRQGEFLMGKVISSIACKRVIEIEDTHFYRDLTTPVDIANVCLSNENWKEAICGSGKLYKINDVITELYKSAGLDKADYVVEKFTKTSPRRDFSHYDLSAKNLSCIGGPRLDAVEWMKSDLSDGFQRSYFNGRSSR